MFLERCLLAGLSVATLNCFVNKQLKGETPKQRSSNTGAVQFLCASYNFSEQDQNYCYGQGTCFLEIQQRTQSIISVGQETWTQLVAFSLNPAELPGELPGWVLHNQAQEQWRTTTFCLSSTFQVHKCKNKRHCP